MSYDKQAMDNDLDRKFADSIENPSSLKPSDVHGTLQFRTLQRPKSSYDIDSDNKISESNQIVYCTPGKDKESNLGLISSADSIDVDFLPENKWDSASDLSLGSAIGEISDLSNRNTSILSTSDDTGMFLSTSTIHSDHMTASSDGLSLLETTSFANTTCGNHGERFGSQYNGPNKFYYDSLIEGKLADSSTQENFYKTTLLFQCYKNVASSSVDDGSTEMIKNAVSQPTSPSQSVSSSVDDLSQISTEPIDKIFRLKYRRGNGRSTRYHSNPEDTKHVLNDLRSNRNDHRFLHEDTVSSSVDDLTFDPPPLSISCSDDEFFKSVSNHSDLKEEDIFSALSSSVDYLSSFGMNRHSGFCNQRLYNVITSDSSVDTTFQQDFLDGDPVDPYELKNSQRRFYINQPNADSDGNETNKRLIIYSSLKETAREDKKIAWSKTERAETDRSQDKISIDDNIYHVFPFQFKEESFEKKLESSICHERSTIGDHASNQINVTSLELCESEEMPRGQTSNDKTFPSKEDVNCEVKAHMKLCDYSLTPPIRQGSSSLREDVLNSCGMRNRSGLMFQTKAPHTNVKSKSSRASGTGEENQILIMSNEEYISSCLFQPRDPIFHNVRDSPVSDGNSSPGLHKLASVTRGYEQDVKCDNEALKSKKKQQHLVVPLILDLKTHPVIVCNTALVVQSRSKRCVINLACEWIEREVAEITIATIHNIRQYHTNTIYLDHSIETKEKLILDDQTLNVHFPGIPKLCRNAEINTALLPCESLAARCIKPMQKGDFIEIKNVTHLPSEDISFADIHENSYTKEIEKYMPTGQMESGVKLSAILINSAQSDTAVNEKTTPQKSEKCYHLPMFENYNSADSSRAMSKIEKYKMPLTEQLDSLHGQKVSDFKSANDKTYYDSVLSCAIETPIWLVTCSEFIDCLEIPPQSHDHILNRPLTPETILDSEVLPTSYSLQEVSRTLTTFSESFDQENEIELGSDNLAFEMLDYTLEEHEDDKTFLSLSYASQNYQTFEDKKFEKRKDTEDYLSSEEESEENCPNKKENTTKMSKPKIKNISNLKADNVTMRVYDGSDACRTSHPLMFDKIRNAEFVNQPEDAHSHKWEKFESCLAGVSVGLNETLQMYDWFDSLDVYRKKIRRDVQMVLNISEEVYKPSLIEIDGGTLEPSTTCYSPGFDQCVFIDKVAAADFTVNEEPFIKKDISEEMDNETCDMFCTISDPIESEQTIDFTSASLERPPSPEAIDDEVIKPILEKNVKELGLCKAEPGEMVDFFNSFSIENEIEFSEDTPYCEGEMKVNTQGSRDFSTLADDDVSEQGFKEESNAESVEAENRLKYEMPLATENLSLEMDPKLIKETKTTSSDTCRSSLILTLGEINITENVIHHEDEDNPKDDDLESCLAGASVGLNETLQMYDWFDSLDVHRKNIRSDVHMGLNISEEVYYKPSLIEIDASTLEPSTTCYSQGFDQCVFINKFAAADFTVHEEPFIKKDISEEMDNETYDMFCTISDPIESKQTIDFTSASLERPPSPEAIDDEVIKPILEKNVKELGLCKGEPGEMVDFFNSFSIENEIEFSEETQYYEEGRKVTTQDSQDLKTLSEDKFFEQGYKGEINGGIEESENGIKYHFGTQGFSSKTYQKLRKIETNDICNSFEPLQLGENRNIEIIMDHQDEHTHQNEDFESCLAGVSAIESISISPTGLSSRPENPSLLVDLFNEIKDINDKQASTAFLPNCEESFDLQAEVEFGMFDSLSESNKADSPEANIAYLAMMKCCISEPFETSKTEIHEVKAETHAFRGQPEEIEDPGVRNKKDDNRVVKTLEELTTQIEAPEGTERLKLSDE